MRNFVEWLHSIEGPQRTRHGADETAAPDGATGIAPENSGTTLAELQASLVVDDSTGGGGADAEGQAIEVHG